MAIANYIAELERLIIVFELPEEGIVAQEIRHLIHQIEPIAETRYPDDVEYSLLIFANVLETQADFVSNNVRAFILNIWRFISDETYTPPENTIISNNDSNDDYTTSNYNTDDSTSNYNADDEYSDSDDESYTISYLNNITYDHNIEDIFKQNPFSNIDDHKSLKSIIFDFETNDILFDNIYMLI